MGSRQKITLKSLEEDLASDSPRYFTKKAASRLKYPEEVLLKFFAYNTDFKKEAYWRELCSQESYPSDERLIRTLLSRFLAWSRVVQGFQLPSLQLLVPEVRKVLPTYFSFATGDDISSFKELTRTNKEKHFWESLVAAAGGQDAEKLKARPLFRQDAIRMSISLPPSPHGIRMRAFLFIATKAVVPVEFWVCSRLEHCYELGGRWVISLEGQGRSGVVKVEVEKGSLEYEAFDAYATFRKCKASSQNESLFGFSTTQAIVQYLHEECAYGGFPKACFCAKSLSNGAICSAICSALLRGESREDAKKHIRSLVGFERPEKEIKLLLGSMQDRMENIYGKQGATNFDHIDELAILHEDLCQDGNCSYEQLPKPARRQRFYLKRHLCDGYEMDQCNLRKALVNHCNRTFAPTRDFVPTVDILRDIAFLYFHHCDPHHTFVSAVNLLLDSGGGQECQAQKQVIQAMVSTKLMTCECWDSCAVGQNFLDWFALPPSTGEAKDRIPQTYNADHSTDYLGLFSVSKARRKRNRDFGPQPKVGGELLSGMKICDVQRLQNKKQKSKN
jgi:hypothetical protein